MDMQTAGAHIRERMTSISTRDLKFILGISVASAFLAIPFLHNLGVFSLLARFGVPFGVAVLILFVLSPIGFLALSYVLVVMPLRHDSAEQLSRYGAVGIFNLLLNAAIFNALIIASGISSGPWVTFFALVSFGIVITQSLFWNAIWTFKKKDENGKIRYTRFFIVTIATALVNLGIIQILVNVVGAPPGIPTPLWANIALLITIVTAIVGNFLGYKLFVFA
jgi:putative flippase GtrA